MHKFVKTRGVLCVRWFYEKDAKNATKRFAFGAKTKRYVESGEKII